MTSIDSRSPRALRHAFVALVALALLASSLAVYAASPARVLAASKVVDVTLSVGRTISGTILKRTSATTTAAAPNIDIQACLVSTTQYVCRYATTALNGTYLVNQLVPGKYTIEIINYDDAVNLQSGWYTTANTAHFNVAPAGASQVDTTLGNKTGINSTVPIGFKISGIVHLGTTATSVAGVPVQVCAVTGYICRSTSTIAGGVYTVQGLAPGQYTIGASKSDQNYVDGYYRTLVANNFTPTASLATKQTITTANLTGRTFTLPVGFKITGFVKTTANVAIAGAGVTVSGLRYRSTSTTSTGAFTVQGLPAGTYQVGVTNPYTQPTLGDVFFRTAVVGQYTWDPATASNVVITTASKAIGTIQEPVGKTISGKITHGAGVALAGTSVSAIDTTASSSSFFFFFGGGYATSSATGTWSIQGLRPGTYRIGASPSDYPPTNDVGGYYRAGLTGNYVRNLEQGSVVDVRTANQTTLPINLPAGNTVTGTIKGGAVGLPNASVTVYSMGNTEFFYGYTNTDATGHYSITGIPNGRFIVSIDSPYDKNYLDGYYRNAPVANFTAASASATPIIFGDGTAPAITAKAPATGATGVSRLANVTATFSEPVINVSTRTIYLRKAGTFVNIAAVVTYNATTRQATLNPSVTLAASTSYTATIYDVFDGTGNQVTSTSWSFTTGL